MQVTPTKLEVWSRGVKDDSNHVTDLFRLTLYREPFTVPPNTLWLVISLYSLLAAALGFLAFTLFTIVKMRKQKKAMKQANRKLSEVSKSERLVDKELQID